MTVHILHNKHYWCFPCILLVNQNLFPILYSIYFFVYSLSYFIYIFFYREENQNIYKTGKHTHTHTHTHTHKHTHTHTHTLKLMLTNKNILSSWVLEILQTFLKFISNSIYTGLALIFSYICSSNVRILEAKLKT